MKRAGQPRGPSREHMASAAHQEVLAVAERLFTERGYIAVTLRDIAEVLGMRQASLYYHAPGGKEQLFQEALLRRLARYHQQMTEILATAQPLLRQQLMTLSNWLLAQPPVDLLRLYRSDLAALTPERAADLGQRAHDTFLAPLEHLLDAAYARGETRATNTKLIAATYFSTIEAIHDLHRLTGQPTEALAEEAITVLLDGLTPR